MSLPAVAPRAVSRTLIRAAITLGAAVLVAGCGGGDPLVEFRAQRVLALGDETSVITASGRKYTIDALKADNVTIDCEANPIWVQTVANSFGLVFPECNPAGVPAPRSRILAAPGAKVADVKAQIDAHLAGDSFASRDLVTILVGRHDVLDIYRRYPTISVAQAIGEAEAAGAALAVQVNRVAAAGGKVLLAKVLDLGQTPFALAEKAANTDIDRAALLTNLAARFNTRLRLDIVNDGRMIGLVQSDERIQSVVASPGNFAFDNVTQPACLPGVSVLDCTARTLVTPATGSAPTASTWLWADSLNLSPGGHFRIGEVAASVANNNPF